LMMQLLPVYLTVGRVAVANRLLSRMKINCAVYRHWAPPFVDHNPHRESNNSRQEVPVS